MSPLAPFHSSPYNSPRAHLAAKLDNVDDDKQSLISRSSGNPRAEQGLDTLRLVAGNRVRHARCAPEYLEEMAVKGVPESVKKAATQKFKVIAGQEARTYFKNFVDKRRQLELNSSRKEHDPVTNHEMPLPIVFAVTVWEGSNKCVDYHMTWRGLSKAATSAGVLAIPAYPNIAKPGTDVEDKIELLDTQFKELARVLDREYKQKSSLTSYRSSSQTRRSTHPESRTTSSTHRKSRTVPALTISPSDETASNEYNDVDPSLPQAPNSATDSVMSLPLLNMVRGVPLSHHVPLRVTNPDRLSFISEDAAPILSSAVPVNDKKDIKLAIPEYSAIAARTDSGDSSKWSMDSVSSDPKSNLSSRPSSRYSSPNSSPDDHGRHAKMSKDGSLDESLKFTIVLLGTSLDKDENSWHGLDRQTSIRSIPSDRHSPWIGQLARPQNAKDRRHTPIHTPIHTPSDSDSEASNDPAHWKNVPVIPLKPLMESMGLVPPSNTSHYSPAVVPRYIPSVPSVSQAGSSGYHTPASMSNITLPAQNSSPYIYASPRLDCSPYPSPGWQQNALPQSRPPSIAYSAVSRSSPYEYPRHHPF